MKTYWKHDCSLQASKYLKFWSGKKKIEGRKNLRWKRGNERSIERAKGEK